MSNDNFWRRAIQPADYWQQASISAATRGSVKRTKDKATARMILEARRQQGFTGDGDLPPAARPGGED